MLVAGPFGLQQRLTEANLHSWTIAPDVVWPQTANTRGSPAVPMFVSRPLDLPESQTREKEPQSLSATQLP